MIWRISGRMIIDTQRISVNFQVAFDNVSGQIPIADISTTALRKAGFLRGVKKKLLGFDLTSLEQRRTT